MQLKLEAFPVNDCIIPRKIGSLNLESKQCPIIVATSPEGQAASQIAATNPSSHTVRPVFLIDTSEPIDSATEDTVLETLETCLGRERSHSNKATVIQYNSTGGSLHKVDLGESEIAGFTSSIEFAGTPDFAKATELIAEKVLTANNANKRLLAVSLHTNPPGMSDLKGFYNGTEKFDGGVIGGINNSDGRARTLHLLSALNNRFVISNLEDEEKGRFAGQVQELRKLLAEAEHSVRLETDTSNPLLFASRPSFARASRVAGTNKYNLGYRTTNTLVGFAENYDIGSIKVSNGASSTTSRIQALNYEEIQIPARDTIGHLLCYLCLLEKAPKELHAVLNDFEIDLRPIGNPPVSELVKSLGIDGDRGLYEKALMHFANAGNHFDTPEEARVKIASKPVKLPEETPPPQVISAVEPTSEYLSDTRDIWITPRNGIRANTPMVPRLKEERFTIGTMAGSTLLLNDDSIKPAHCSIYEDDGKLWIKSLDETGETLLNDAPINMPTTLTDGDTLQVGEKLKYTIAILPQGSEPPEYNNPIEHPPIIRASQVKGASKKLEPITLPLPADKDRIVIGRVDKGKRDPNLDVTTRCPKASREHCRIKKIRRKTYGVKDLGSTNGTTVNGEPVSTRTDTILNDGDLIRVGDQVIKVEIKSRFRLW